MKVPYVIYADFEALIRKISLCKQKEGIKESFTEKTEWHEVCGYAYSVVRNDGLTSIPKVYRGENAVERFLMDMMQEEKTIRESLSTPKPLIVTPEDWEKHNNATNCHICEKRLVKDLFLDSIQVYDHNTGCYCGQSHKRCYFKATKEINFIGPKAERKRKIKLMNGFQTIKKHV